MQLIAVVTQVATRARSRIYIGHCMVLVKFVLPQTTVCFKSDKYLQKNSPTKSNTLTFGTKHFGCGRWLGIVNHLQTGFWYWRETFLGHFRGHPKLCFWFCRVWGFQDMKVMPQTLWDVLVLYWLNHDLIWALVVSIGFTKSWHVYMCVHFRTCPWNVGIDVAILFA